MLLEQASVFGVGSGMHLSAAALLPGVDNERCGGRRVACLPSPEESLSL
jgi:hypothetical protein